jgi:hypothetical protein
MKRMPIKTSISPKPSQPASGSATAQAKRKTDSISKTTNNIAMR